MQFSLFVLRDSRLVLHSAHAVSPVRLPGRQKLEIQIDCNDQANICSSLFFIRNLFVMKEDWIWRKSIFALLLFARGRETISCAWKYIARTKKEGNLSYLAECIRSTVEKSTMIGSSALWDPGQLLLFANKFSLFARKCNGVTKTFLGVARPAGNRQTFYCATSPLSPAGSTLQSNLLFYWPFITILSSNSQKYS